MTLQLILVRHPPPQIAPGICYGSTDLALAPGQLARAVAALSNTLPPHLPLYSSSLRRCADLATELAARRPGSAVNVDARLAELDFGNWEMRAWDEIPREEIDAWAADPIHYRPGGGESVLQMAARIHDWHGAMARRARARAIERAIVICHAGTMRLLAAWHSDLSVMAMQAASTGHHIAHGATIVVNC